MIGWEVAIGEKIEWWRVVIGWEENVDEEVAIFWDKSWELEAVIFWDEGSKKEYNTLFWAWFNIHNHSSINLSVLTKSISFHLEYQHKKKCQRPASSNIYIA